MTFATRFTRTAYVIAITLCLAAPGIVMAQAKWEPVGGVEQTESKPIPMTPPPSHVATPADRAADDRTLDELATKFYAIKTKDPKAVEKLKHLQGKVWAFRKELKSRSYDVTDISRDAKKLSWRVESERKKLEGTASAPSAPAAPPVAEAPAASPAPAAAPSAPDATATPPAAPATPSTPDATATPPAAPSTPSPASAPPSSLTLPSPNGPLVTPPAAPATPDASATPPPAAPVTPAPASATLPLTLPPAAPASQAAPTSSLPPLPDTSSPAAAPTAPAGR